MRAPSPTVTVTVMKPLAGDTVVMMVYWQDSVMIIRVCWDCRESPRLHRLWLVPAGTYASFGPGRRNVVTVKTRPMRGRQLRRGRNRIPSAGHLDTATDNNDSDGPDLDYKSLHLVVTTHKLVLPATYKLGF